MKRKHLLSTFLSLSAASTCLAADSAPGNGIYIGAFGGAGASIASSLRQRGAVHINQHFSLPIDARGSTSSSTRVSLGGAHIGYQGNDLRLGQSQWAVSPAVELEGIYIGKHSPTGEMPVRPQALGMQYVTVPMTVGLAMANAVFTLQTPYSNTIRPYVGVGAGAAFLSIKNSDSANPSEPGINHFNSDPDASASAFAMQLKLGFKAELQKNLQLFTEYRYLSINSTRYTFGETDYPGLHLPTAPWHVNLGRQKYNLFVAGVQYQF